MNTSLSAPVEFKGNMRLLLGIVFSILTYWLFTQSLMIILPEIKNDIYMNNSIANWSIGLSGLISGCFIVLAGSLSDVFGRVKFILIGLIVNIIACLCIILTNHQVFFLIGRILQGVSAACILSSALAVVKYFYQGKERQKAISFALMGSFGGSSLCTFVSGGLNYILGWESIFIISILMSICALLLIKGTPETKTSHKKYQLDYKGLMSLIIILVTLNIFVTKVSAMLWTIVPMLLVIIIFVFLFIKIEKHKKDTALIDFSIFSNPFYRSALMINFFVNMGAGFLVINNNYLQMGLSLNTLEVGYISIGFAFGLLVSIRIGEKLLQKYGAKKPILLGLIFCILGSIFSSYTASNREFYLVLVSIAYLLFGIGLALQATPVSDTAMSNIDIEKASIAGATLQMSSALGGSFGIAISISLYSLISSLYNIEIGAQISLLVVACLYIMTCIYVLLYFPKNKTIV